ncbi:hypothetical protein KNP414_05171 [Paenibacillus mucilaginosus KNP414]|uniref:Uncharacterized protein n=1 Tax=Paenibacillus mucilaginosus (strain KNP414) TaxID=1036673 RepID=F8F9K6_PAEMK|nr:hypothetical protein KNP414_05171 [Paenibacillus mucilaginosus KNP414]
MSPFPLHACSSLFQVWGCFQVVRVMSVYPEKDKLDTRQELEGLGHIKCSGISFCAPLCFA